MKHFPLYKGVAISVFAVLTVLLASTSYAAPANTDTSLFKMTEVNSQIAMKSSGQQCSSTMKTKKGNPVVNNKFTEHVCAAHVFHPKRKAMERRERQQMNNSNKAG